MRKTEIHTKRGHVFSALMPQLHLTVHSRILAMRVLRNDPSISIHLRSHLDMFRRIYTRNISR